MMCSAAQRDWSRARFGNRSDLLLEFPHQKSRLAKSNRLLGNYFLSNPAFVFRSSRFVTQQTDTSFMITQAASAHEIERAIRNVPDFPKPGIQFKDITPVLADARLFAGTIDLLTGHHAPGSVDLVVGIDARGFIFAAAAALRLGAGFVPVRKQGQLPFPTHEQ